MSEKRFELFLLKHLGIAHDEDAKTKAQPVDSFADIANIGERVEKFSRSDLPGIEKKDVVDLCVKYHGELGFEHEPFLDNLVLRRSGRLYVAIIDVAKFGESSAVAYTMCRY